MSIHWTVRCNECGEDGPDIRIYSHPHDICFNGDNQAWIDFLLEHEWHGRDAIVLRHEGYR